MQNKYTVSFILGLIGSILALLSEVGVMLIGTLGTSFGASSGTTLIGLGVVSFLFAIIALVFTCLISKMPKVAGMVLIICAIIGFICSFMAFLIPAVLLIIAGIIAVVKKN